MGKPPGAAAAMRPAAPYGERGGPAACIPRHPQRLMPCLSAAASRIYQRDRRRTLPQPQRTPKRRSSWRRMPAGSATPAAAMASARACVSATA